MTFNSALMAEAPNAVPGPEVAGLFQAGRVYDRPTDVLADANLTAEEQRAILSAWASDACAVESVPALRHAPFASRPVSFDEIMDALVSLDRFHPGTAAGDATRNRESPERLDA